MLGLCKYINWRGWSRPAPVWKCCEVTFVVEWWYEFKDGWLVGLKYECGTIWAMGRKATQLSEQMLAKLISAKLQIRSKCMFLSVVTLHLFGFSIYFFSSQRCAYGLVLAFFLVFILGTKPPICRPFGSSVRGFRQRAANWWSVLVHRFSASEGTLVSASPAI